MALSPVAGPQQTTDPFSLDNAIQGADLAVSIANNYVIGPIARLGIAGLQLNIFKILKSELASDITDQYSESNAAIQDHIALKPERYTIYGQIGELVFQNTKPPSEIQKIATKLVILAGFLPVISDSMKQLQAGILSATTPGEYFDAALGNGIDLYQTFKKLNPPKTKQAQAYNYFSAIRNARQLISFDSPWGFKANFALENFIFSQPEKTESYSDVELTLKQIRTVTTRVVKFDPKKYQGRSTGQTAPAVNNGTTQGSPLPTTPVIPVI